MKKDQIRKNFSKNARSYDKYSSIQKHCAEQLSFMFPDTQVDTVLDVGCGTGHLTKLLKQKYKDSSIKAVDISLEMIGVAKDKIGSGVNFVVADAEELEDNAQYDVIASNATFQWFYDSEKSIKALSKLMTHGAKLVFSVFGPLTYNELAWALGKSLNKNIALASKDFLGKTEIEKILKKHFPKYSVREEVIKEKSKSLRDLLAKIKYSGTRGVGNLTAGLMGKEKLKKAEELYLAKYGDIVATHQVFYCEAQS